MNKPTKKEMLDMYEYLAERAHWDCSSAKNQAIVQAIRHLIENMSKKVSKKFVEERVNEMEQMFMQRSSRMGREWFIEKRVLSEAGLEVEEKEG